MEIVGFGAQNFRSFGSEGFLVPTVEKINIFIGRNNSGKSNVLAALRILSQFSIDKFDTKATDQHQGSNDPIILVFLVSQSVPRRNAPNEDVRLQLRYDIRNKRALLPADSFANITDEEFVNLHNELTTSRYQGRPGREQLTRETTELLWPKVRQEVKQKIENLIYIPAIREVRLATDGKTEAKGFDPSGQDIIHHLRRMQHPVIGKEHEQKIFQNIEQFVAELLNESADRVLLEIPADENDIYVTMYGNRLPLQSFGTGVHELVILCSTLAIHSNRWICIEEPELHLHPELIRRFVRFLNATGNTYFITTHSNVLLDAEAKGMVYHVTFNGKESRFVQSTSLTDHRRILHDLAFRASDLLQANGIIWVEGPSDRVYINKWLHLVTHEFIEGIHYSFMFYGGSVLADVSFADPPFSEDFLEVLRINSNAFLVIDSDITPTKRQLREYKQRVHDEIGENRCWITKGKEIENYLRPELIRSYLSKYYSVTLARQIKFEQADDLESTMKRVAKPTKVSYSKVRDSRRFVDLMTTDDLNCLDLKRWIERLATAIKQWNIAAR